MESFERGFKLSTRIRPDLAESSEETPFAIILSLTKPYRGKVFRTSGAVGRDEAHSERCAAPSFNDPCKYQPEWF